MTIYSLIRTYKYKAKNATRAFLSRRNRLRKALSRLRFSLAKGKIKYTFHCLLSGHLIRKAKIHTWIKNHQQLCLQIGGGKHIKTDPNWLNGDLIAGDIYINAQKQLPFPDNSLDLIFTEHFIEHLPQQSAITFLKESHRILKPSGVLRISTPDLKGILEVYQDRNNIVSQKTAVDRHIYNHRSSFNSAEGNACQFVNDMFRLWGHHYIYDKASLINALKISGFQDFQTVEFGKPGFHSFSSNLERHADEEWMKNAFVIILEARK